MNIAYTLSDTRGATDSLLFEVARALGARGLETVGVVQINAERSGGGRCDMDLQVLPAGEILRISQNLGAGACGCRLDPDALERAVGKTEAALARGADCVIINKFGKQEAEGRGFRPVIAEALAQGIPVLVGVNRLNFEAFEAFAGGLACEVEGGFAELVGWVEGLVAPKDTVAAPVRERTGAEPVLSVCAA